MKNSFPTCDKRHSKKKWACNAKVLYYVLGKELFTFVYMSIYVHIYEELLTQIWSLIWVLVLQIRFLDWYLSRFGKALFIYK